MDCFLKVIKGPDAGASCKLGPGVNLVGRSVKAALKLSPADISWEHLSINRNGDNCVAENLSASGTYLDDARLTGPVRLRSKDQIRLSKETVVRFETVGGTDSSNRGLLFLLLLVLTVVAVVVLILTSDDKQADWDTAYNQIATWTHTQASAGRLPTDLPRMFANAWRLEQAEDYTGSRAAWLQLKLLLDADEAKYALGSRSLEHAQALSQMLAPQPGVKIDPTDDDLAAALNQFINRRLTYSTAQALAAKGH